jgi:hypothetical protein
MAEKDLAKECQPTGQTRRASDVQFGYRALDGLPIAFSQTVAELFLVSSRCS